jgi:hypothetical protein
VAGGTEADLPAMDAMARRLNESADSLDAAGNRSPGVPNAGDVSGIMASALAYLAGSAGNLVLGLRGASEAVTQSRNDYAKKDQSAAQSFRGHGNVRRHQDRRSAQQYPCVGRLVEQVAGAAVDQTVTDLFAVRDRAETAWAGDTGPARPHLEASRSAETRERRYTGPVGAGIEGLPSMVIRTYWLGANALPAYLALQHYFGNPGERPGLGSPAAPADE